MVEKKNQAAKEYIMEMISSLPPGSKIPSERELMTHLGVSRPTIQHAIDSLQLEGYLYKVNRQGTFTALYPRHTHLNRMQSFFETVQDLGAISYSTTVLEHSTVPANEFLANKMACSVGDNIHYFLRLRKYANTPAILEYAYFLDWAVKNISVHAAERSIYRYVEDVMKLPIDFCDNFIDAVLPEQEIAKLLEIPVTEPVIQMERISMLKDGRIFEYGVSYSISRYNKFAVRAIRYP